MMLGYFMFAWIIVGMVVTIGYLIDMYRECQKRSGLSRDEFNKSISDESQYEGKSKIELIGLLLERIALVFGGIVALGIIWPVIVYSVTTNREYVIMVVEHTLKH